MSNSKSFADYLSDWFSDYEPVDKNLHTKVAMFLSFIFIYTGLAIQKSRSWFFWDQPFDSPVIGSIFIIFSWASFAYLSYLYRSNPNLFLHNIQFSGRHNQFRLFQCELGSHLGKSSYVNIRTIFYQPR
jgi:hypothetical protein